MTPQSTAQSSCKITDGKVILIAGAIFLAITLVASIALIISHPGTIVYQGNGVILTLSTVIVLSAGGTLSLVVIALGSYRWWKQRQERL